MCELSNVIKTLFHLESQIHLVVEILNEIGNHHKTLQEIKFQKFFKTELNLELATHTIISNHAIILFCSFMDEYEQKFNPAHLDKIDGARILSVQSKNRPGVKRLKKWSDLKDFRNYIAAHNFRIRGKSFFSDEIELLQFKIPNKVSEKNLFVGIIYFICLNIKEEFPEIVATMNPDEIMLNKIKFLSSEVDNEKELTGLMKAMKIV